jgi:hypothetical protein
MTVDPEDFDKKTFLNLVETSCIDCRKPRSKIFTRCRDPCNQKDRLVIPIKGFQPLIINHINGYKEVAKATAMIAGLSTDRRTDRPFT